MFHEEDDPPDLGRLLACLKARERHPEARFHYRVRFSSIGRVPSAAVVGNQLGTSGAPAPAASSAWVATLARDWPPPLRGLHRIELVPGRAWVSVAIGLAPARLGRPQPQPQPQAQAQAQPSLSRAANPGGGPEAMVIGAGLAGCAMADALARRGWRVTVIESESHVGGAVAGIPLLAQHPALSPGNDRRSRLLLAALLTTRRLADRFGDAMTWCGRFQPMPLAEAIRRTAGIAPSIARPVPVSDAVSHGVAGREGVWYPDCALADPQLWWARVRRLRGVTLRLSQPVAALSRSDGRWNALDCRGAAIASCAVAVLANQAHAFTLAGMPGVASGRLRLDRLQVAVGTALGSMPPQRHATILGGSSYRLEDGGRHCIVGPLQPGGDALPDHQNRVPDPTIHDPAYRWHLSEPAERLLLRDSLPMIGAAPDSTAVLEAPGPYLRNDRLPLPRHAALHLLTGLGGRGLLWSVLGAEMIAAALNDEPAVVEPDLEAAVDPARFLKRSLRRGEIAAPA